MKHLRFALLAAALASALVAVVYAAEAPKSITIKMVAENGSGENGSATLTQVADGVLVAVKLDNTPQGTPQPTHIHIGTCAKINKAPEYPLANTVNGASTSTVRGIALSDLLKGKYAINVHKSASELGTYVSCGNIVVSSPAK